MENLQQLEQRLEQLEQRLVQEIQALEQRVVSQVGGFVNGQSQTGAQGNQFGQQITQAPPSPPQQDGNYGTTNQPDNNNPNPNPAQAAGIDQNAQQNQQQ